MVQPSLGSSTFSPAGVEAGGDVWPPQWMLNLERAHNQLRHAARLLENGAQPVIDLRPAAQLLAETCGKLYAAYDEREDRLAATRAGISLLDAAIINLKSAVELDAAIGFAVEYLREARGELGAAETRLAPLVSRVRPQGRDVRASNDIPMLQALDRPSLLPELKVPDPLPEDSPETEREAELHPQTFEELDVAIQAMKDRVAQRKKDREEQRKKEQEERAEERAAKGQPREAPPGFTPDLPAKVAPLVYVAQRARECFEEVAMIGMQRAPLLGDPWRNTLFLERRMLAAIDAVVALGPHALAQLEPWVKDAPAKDPSRVFAIGMVLGCVEGRDALAAAERAFFALELADPEVARNFAGALKLAPHPLLPVALRTLLADNNPAHRALAIDVLGYRGLATSEELARAAVDVPDVARIALPYFATRRHPAVRATIDAAFEKKDPKLSFPVWLAMAFSGHPYAALAPSRELDGEHAEDAALCVALAGDTQDAQRLLQRARERTTRPLITAVGWSGAAAAIPALLEWLEHDDDEVKLSTAYALDRITGAGLYEEMEAPAEEIMVPDPPDPDVGALSGPPSLARVVSDPRDVPPEAAPETVQRPTTDAARWRAYWTEHEERYDLRARYRRGRPYSPYVSFEELDRWPVTPGERRNLQRELVIRTGSLVRLDPHDFIKVQEEALKQWGPLATQASSQPGVWTVPMRKF